MEPGLIALTRMRRSFKSVVHVRGESFAGDDRGIQNDGRPIRHQWECLLYREKDTFHVDVERGVVELLADRTERRVSRKSRVREHNIEPALLSFDLSEQTIKVAKVRHVPLHAGYISSDLFYRSSQFRLAAA